MATRTYVCEKCGTTTTHEYDDCGSYSSMFNEGEWTSIYCSNRECRNKLDTVKEY